ncbi:MAG: hypothetical protein V4726_05755 [Verrucomicrobiota bacterium]
MKIPHSKTPLILVFLLAGLQAEAATIADNPSGSFIVGPAGDRIRYTFSNFLVLNSSITGTGILYEADDVVVAFSSGHFQGGVMGDYYYTTVEFSESSGVGFNGGTGRGSSFTISYDVVVERAEGAGPVSPGRASYVASEYHTPLSGVGLTLTASDGFNTVDIKKPYPGANLSSLAPQFTVVDQIKFPDSPPPGNGHSYLYGLRSTFIAVPEIHSASLLLSLSALACRRRR